MKMLVHLARNTLKSRWMVVVAGLFIMSVSGSIYAFGVYSGALKKSLGYNQKTLNTVGFFKDFGNIGIFAGIIADLFPAWVTLSIGVGFNTVGYLMIWLSVTKRIAKPALSQMFLYITIGGNSIAFTHAGALVTCVKDFPLHRGMIVGLLKGFLGLSAAILTLIYRAIYGNHPSAFILLITYLPFAVILLSMFFIRPVPVPVGGFADGGGGSVVDEAKVFYRLLIFELLVAGYLMMVILIQHSVEIGKSVNGAFAGGLAILFCIPFAMVVMMEGIKLKKNRRGSDVEMIRKEEWATDQRGVMTEDESKVPEAKVGEADDHDGSCKEKLQARIQPRDSSEDENSPAAGDEVDDQKKRGSCLRFLHTPAIGQDFTVWQALVHVDFWLLSIASTAGLGAGLMLIDNLGQVGASYGYDERKTGTFVSLISIWNCLGRVGSGFVSEYFLQKRGLARPFFFALALGLSAIGYLAIALDLPGALFIGSILIGFCFGAQWSLLHIIVSEIFGLKYYGTLQSIIAMASPLGTYLLSVRVAGYLYDQEGDRQLAKFGATTHRVVNGKDVTCNGTVCYRTTMLIMCAVCSAGCLLTMVMTLRTRRFYKREVYEKLKSQKMELVKAKEAAATAAAANFFDLNAATTGWAPSVRCLMMSP